jgi:upstream activation factor subunit UAF30
MPRTEVTKRMWAYIRENNLQNPDDKREILCDAALEKLFKRKKFTMFKMTKYLAPMQKSIDSLQDAPSTKSKPKTSPKPKPKAVKSEGSSNSKTGKNSLKETKTKKTKETKSSGTKEKKSGGGGGGFAAVCDLSPALSKFLGVDELPR